MRRPTSQRLLLALGVACWLAGPGASASRGEEIIRLPPYLVEGKLPGRPWRYARMPGFEVLSRCYDTKSRALAFAYYQAQQQLTALIPARFLGRFDVPTKLILYDDSLWPATLEESAAAILRSSPLIPETPKGPPPGAPTPFDRIRADDPILQPPPIYRPPIKVVEGPTTYSQAPVFFDDMRLTDDDAIVLFTVAPADNTNYYRRYLRPTYLAQLLAARTPTLPSWFVAGFLDLYERLDFAEDTITLGAFVWSNREETETAKKDPAPIVGQWLPLVELLSEDAEVLARRQGAASRIATEQLRLFVRWALDPEGGARRESFWRLVDRSCREPVTEALLRTTFGRSSAQITQELARYFRSALRHPVAWQSPEVPTPAMEFADASRADSARIRGDWERLQAAYVREAAPEFAAKYRDKAHFTLEHAYGRGERDPRLLAVLGLNELDGGDRARAEALLAIAVRAQVLRPRVYVELARLKLADEVGGLKGDAKLTRRQADTVLDLLDAADAQSPHLPATFRIALDVWEHCGVAPDADRLAFLARGAADFPRSAELACRAAKILLANGRETDAMALVAKATRLGASDAYLQPLRNLRAALAAAGAK